MFGFLLGRIFIAAWNQRDDQGYKGHRHILASADGQKIPMPRFVRDPQLREFQHRVRTEVERIASLAQDAAYVIYTIRDPTLIDHHRHHPDGPPIYVGQTNRAEDHMKDGGRGTQGGRLKAGRLHQIMKKFVVPKFQILDGAPTHLTSLIAETVWARRYCWCGYELANQWAEHKSKTAPNGLDSVSTGRLWNFTVADAIEDEVSLVLICKGCGIDKPVELTTLKPEARLSQMRALHMKCPGCSGPLLQIEQPDTATWKWRSYAPAPMGADC